jgi:hypothetical protein
VQVGPWSADNPPNTNPGPAQENDTTVVILPFTGSTQNTSNNNGTFSVTLNGVCDGSGNCADRSSAVADGAGPVLISYTVQQGSGGAAGRTDPGDVVIFGFSEAIANAPGTTTVQLENQGGQNPSDRVHFSGVLSGLTPTNSTQYISGNGNRPASWAGSNVQAVGTTLRVTVGNTCSGSGCAGNTSSGTAALHTIPGGLAPATSLQDGAGNTAAGTFVPAGQIRLF